jgi:leucyl aminopeptidase
MQFPVKTSAPVKQKTACAIVPLFESGALPRVTAEFDKASHGQLRALKRSGEISGSKGRAVLLHHIRGNAAERVLVVGCGKRKSWSGKSLYAAMSVATRLLKRSGIREAVSFLTYGSSDLLTDDYGARLTVEAARAATYEFNELKSGPKATAKVRRIGIAVHESQDARNVRLGIACGVAVSNGADLARNLGNRPANVCTPQHLADAAGSLAKVHKSLRVEVLNEKEIEKLGMGSFLSVTRGTPEPPRLIVMHYTGASSDSAPVAICGKGITFDTGGISIKPPPKMDEMKFDMCGAAGVLGTLAAIAELDTEINVVAVLPACENMPSGSATRPGDIVKSMSGKTIEILNTDAEGRLILCDALTYAQTFDPSCVIDVATLTGSCVVALGNVYAGVFSNDDNLWEELLAAGKRSLDVGWPMPMDAEYGDSLSSNFADFANVGAREGGASVAASFLSRFIDGVPWAHVDIAGVAWKTGADKGATGRPVPMLVDFLLSRANDG